MRDSESPVVQACAIVDTIVAMEVQRYIYIDSLKPDSEENAQSIRLIHLYLSSHLDILTMKFVFFTVNDKHQHWRGPVSYTHL